MLIETNTRARQPETVPTEMTARPPRYSCRQIWSESCSGASSSKAECKVRTASSRYFSSMTTEILISEVEIIRLLMPWRDNASNILLATPAWERDRKSTRLNSSHVK